MKQESLRQYMLGISSQVKSLRRKNGLTQVEFAKRAGVGLRFLREFEQGKTTVRMDKLMQVLDFLGYCLELKRRGELQYMQYTAINTERQ
ncbi:MAG: type II toxin-antitoxin system Y4mF family antitoxin [Candidatus Omnitrophota bacterium]